MDASHANQIECLSTEICPIKRICIITKYDKIHGNKWLWRLADKKNHQQHNPLAVATHTNQNMDIWKCVFCCLFSKAYYCICDLRTRWFYISAVVKVYFSNSNADNEFQLF